MGPQRRVITVLLGTLLALPVVAAGEVRQLDRLLQDVRARQAEQQALNRQREQVFIADRQRQQQLLDEAREALERRRRENQPLLAVTERNQATIEALQEDLDAVVADMGDLSSIFREFAGDFRAVLRDSMVSAQLPARGDRLRELADARTQVSIEEIQSLWLLLQEEMTEAGKVTRFNAPVIDTAGAMTTQVVLRAGVFSAWADGDYLRYVPETGDLLSLSRQPPLRFRDAARSFDDAGGPQLLAIDPTRGSVLGRLAYTPDLRERVAQGGTIGLIIIGLGVTGLLLTGWRLVFLALLTRRIRRQLADVSRPDARNPLGRVLLAVEGIGLDDEELLQLKLDEAVLAEMPAIERGNGLIKLFAAISPLLGLLGTVTGMILTFQAISLVGTGDPKLMAGGISQALVTTVLGLVVAIPLLFGHSMVAYLARVMIQRLDEQCAGVLSRNAERREA